MTSFDLPCEINIGGKDYAINADFRDVLEVIGYLNQNTWSSIYVAIALFYSDYEAIQDHEYTEAVNKMFLFINCGEEADEQPSAKLIDWEQDKLSIVSDINRVAGCEVRALPFCHWWTFIAWFNGIGEGQLSTIVTIRNKIRKGQSLSKWEREYYSRNRGKIDFKSKYTEKENAELNKWLGGG